MAMIQSPFTSTKWNMGERNIFQTILFPEGLENTPFTIFGLKMMLKSGLDLFLYCYMRKSFSNSYFNYKVTNSIR